MNLLARCVNSPAAWVLALILAGASAIAFGIVGIGREGFAHGQSDMHTFFIGGYCLRQGLNPYVFFDSCRQGWPDYSAYFLPPQAALLSISLSYLPFSLARVLIVTINLACIIGLAALTMPPKFETDLGVPDPAPSAHWLIPALILGNPFTAHVLWFGQTSLIATASLAAGWVWARRGNAWSGGVLIAIGTIKPQLAVLVILWLVFEQRWKVLTIAAAVALLMSLPQILVIGPIGALTEWLAAIGRYQTYHFNELGYIHLFGLQNFFAVIGFKVPPLLPIGVVAMAVLWWLRKRIEDPDILPLLIGLTLLFGISHDYDLSALVLLLPAFWRHLRDRKVQAFAAVSLMLVLFLPQRLFWAPPRPDVVLSAPLQDALLVQYKVLVVLVFVIWLFMLALRQSSELRSVGGGLLRAR
jgi:hypothetical protein